MKNLFKGALASMLMGFGSAMIHIHIGFLALAAIGAILVGSIAYDADKKETKHDQHPRPYIPNRM